MTPLAADGKCFGFMLGIALAEGMAACRLGRRQQLLCGKYRAFSDFAGNPPRLFRAKQGCACSN